MEIDDDEPNIGADVGISAGDGDGSRAAQDAVWIEGHVALQEVVQRIAVKQRAGSDEDQSFLAIGHIQEAIERMNGLLFVIGVLLASWIGSGCRGRGDGGG